MFSGTLIDFHMTSAPSSEPQSILRGTAIVSGLTLVSRVLGFVRDLLVARLLGAGMFADAFFVAYRIPNLLRSFIAEGALTTAFVPVLAEERRKGQESARRAIQLVSGFLLILTLLLTLLGIALAPWITHLFAPGFDAFPEKSTLCSELTAIMFPFVVCISFVALLNSALNAVGIYGTAAMSQVIMNLVLIAGALLAFSSDEGGAAHLLAWSVVVAGIVQVIYQLPRLHRAGFTIVPIFSMRSPVIRDVVRLMVPAILGASIYQLSIFLMTLLASLLPQGSVSWLYYADRLVQLPIGVFSIALASVLLPSLSRHAAEQNREAFHQELSMALRVTTFVTLPLCALLAVYAPVLVALIFQRGAFDATSAHMTALAIRGMALGIWTSSCHTMLTRACIATRDPRTPTLISALSIIILIGSALLLMGPARPDANGTLAQVAQALQLHLLSAFPGAFLGHAGLAVATTLSSSFALLLLGGVSWRRYGADAFRGCGWTWLKVCIATLGTIGVLSQLIPAELPPLVEVSLLTIALPLYLGFALLLRMPEAYRCLELLRRIIRRSS